MLGKQIKLITTLSIIISNAPTPTSSDINTFSPIHSDDEVSNYSQSAAANCIYTDSTRAQNSSSEQTNALSASVTSNADVLAQNFDAPARNNAHVQFILDETNDGSYESFSPISTPPATPIKSYSSNNIAYEATPPTLPFPAATTIMPLAQNTAVVALSAPAATTIMPLAQNTAVVALPAPAAATIMPLAQNTAVVALPAPAAVVQTQTNAIPQITNTPAATISHTPNAPRAAHYAWRFVTKNKNKITKSSMLKKFNDIFNIFKKPTEQPINEVNIQRNLFPTNKSYTKQWLKKIFFLS